MSWLNPLHARESAISELEQRWNTHPNLRIHDFLTEEASTELHAALSKRTLFFHTTRPGSFRYQYWADAIHIDTEPDPQAGSFARWLYSEAMDWIGAWTGQALHPPPDRQLITTLYTRGCYLDPHNDADGKRAIAFVIGLTPETWPESEGGSLEFLESDSKNVRIAESRAPGWNTIDLFSVHDRTFVHRVPMLRTDRYRRALAGWFYLDPDPSPEVGSASHDGG